MESEQSSTDTPSDSEHSSDAPIDHPLEGFKLTPQDVHVLKGYLEDFEPADTQTRNRILEKAMGDVYRLRPANSAFNKKDAKQKIRKWFYNHYSAPHHQIIKLTRKWSARNAFYQAKREDIMRLAKDISSGDPGSQDFFGALQDATTELWKELPIEEQERYADMPKEWSENAPPKGIQAKMASAGIRGRIVRDFQTQLFKTCGVRCIVLIASEKEDGTPQVALDEWNSRLDDGENFTDFFPEWRNTELWKKWKKYSRRCFATDGDQTAEKDRSKTFKAPIPITTNRNGLPEVPSITKGDSINTKVVQTTLRNYCTAHIRSISGKAKATVPWAKVATNPTAWIHEECYPSGFPWADPSKIKVGDVFSLLDHWRQRKRDGLLPLIWNPSCELLSDAVQKPKQVRNPTHGLRDSPSDRSDDGDEEEDYSRELAKISGHRQDTPTPSPHVSQRMLTTPEPENIGEASNVSSSSQAPQPVQQRNQGLGVSESEDNPNDQPSHHHQLGKRQVKVTDRAMNMDMGRGAGGVKATYLLER
ncbi:hypothetical protein EDB84DRAFT_1447435 [Lactarius hengduanensis]|nr:hypothetical protein EDB84DRAFT_1447435 [Lactarius hengduanensis]